MLKVFFLLVSVAIGIAHDEKSWIAGGTNVGKLIGGEVINNGEFPFMAQIKLQRNGTKNLPHCDASIIAQHAILTAAHCLDGRSPEDLIIFAGNVKKMSPKSTIQKRRAERFVIHENFSKAKMPPRNDIAIIFLTKPFKMTKFVSLIGPSSPEDYDYNSKVTAIGWGRDENGKAPQWLQKTDLFLIPNSQCQEYISKISNNMWQMTDDMGCVFNQNVSATCGGDSGGPLIHNYKLIGITSFSFFKKLRTGEERCNLYYPSGFVRVSNYVSWISDILAANFLL